MNDNNRERFEELGAAVLGASNAEQTEVVLMTDQSYLTRFANNVIHQNVGSRGATVIIRAVTGKRIGVAQAESLDEATLLDTLQRAQAIAEIRPPLKDFKRLPPPRKIRPVEAFDAATADCSPADRAEIVAELVAAARRRRGEAAGLVQTASGEVFVANSRGVRAYHRATEAELQAVVTCRDGSGYAEDRSYALGRIDTRRVIRDSVGKAARSRKPRPIEPGEYDVVLEPAAVGSMVQMLAYMGLGAKPYQEGRSFMSGRLGESITGAAITLVDNAYHGRLRGMPFDFEGVPRKRVKLIDGGVAAGVVYDTYLSGKAHGRKVSTGHALPATYASYGAMPANVVMAGGTASLRQLVASTRRGLLVTRFHYVNIAERMKAVLTGMTRDGTFWIDRGKVSHPVRNLRFTESVLEAFGRTEGLTRQRRAVEGNILCPGMKIRAFRFTGATEF